MTNDCLDQILKEADDCYSNSDYSAAAQQIEKAVDQQPDNAEFWATWGNIQFQAGEYPSAIEKYQEATKLAPEKPDYWTFLALAFLRDEKIDEFETALQSALTIDPDHADSLKLLGDLNFQHGSKADAGMAYLKILQTNPDDTDVLMRLGSCLYEGREFESAKDCYERVLTIDPSNDLALDNMVACKNKLIEPDAPEPTQDPGFQADNIPSDKLHSLLEDAEFFNNSGNPDSTAETLEEAVTLAPNETIIVSALGGVYFKLGKYQKAREMFRKEIELTPSSADAYTRLAMAALSAGEIDEFESSIGIALEIDPQHQEALRFLAKINMQTGRFHDAGRIFANLIEQNPEFAEFYLALGYCFHKGGDSPTAEIVYRRVLEIDPKNQCAIQNLEVLSNGEGTVSHTIPEDEEVVDCNGLEQNLVDFELAYLDKQSNEVKSILKKIFEVTPENYEVLLSLSTMTIQLGEFETAKSLINKAIDLDPTAPEAWTQLSLAELNLGNQDDALLAVNESLSRNYSIDAQRLRGKILYLTEDYQGALTDFKTLLEQSPEDVYLLQCSAICEFKLDNPQDAKGTYEKILSIDPDNELAQNNLNAIDHSETAQQVENPTNVESLLESASKCYTEGNTLSALDHLRRAANLETDNAEIHATLGSLEFEAQHNEEAVTNLSKAVELQPDSPDYLTRLALAEYQAGNIDRFKSFLDKALTHDPEYAPALKTRGDYELGNANFKNAGTDYIAIIKQDAGNVEALLALAVCFFKSNDLETAKATYERVLEFDPENELAIENLKVVSEKIA
ncbi:MAG: hypothetical protein CMO65_06645 [Verrucomicrobiales bacterium]|nr:hypothetical protein [Verrucomicrobiales bacterium]